MLAPYCSIFYSPHALPNARPGVKALKANHQHTTVLRPFFRDHPGELVPENFWTLWCKGRLTEADTQTIRLGATPSGPVSYTHLTLPTIYSV